MEKTGTRATLEENEFQGLRRKFRASQHVMDDLKDKADVSYQFTSISQTCSERTQLRKERQLPKLLRTNALHAVPWPQDLLLSHNRSHPNDIQMFLKHIFTIPCSFA